MTDASAPGWRLGIDTGGTYTDLVAVRGTERRIAKVPAFAVRYNKQAINAMYDAMGFRMAMDYGHKLEVVCHLRIPEAENVHGVRLEQARAEGGVKGFLAARDTPSGGHHSAGGRCQSTVRARLDSSTMTSEKWLVAPATRSTHETSTPSRRRLSTPSSP